MTAVTEFKRFLFRLRVKHGRAVSVYITPSIALVVCDRAGRLSRDQVLTLDRALLPSTNLRFPAPYHLTDRVIYYMPLGDIK
jgi:hypothetical protein